MNNTLLEKRATRINIFIKDTNIAVFNNLDSLDEEKITDIKDSVEFLLKKEELTTDKYISVCSEDEDWSIVMIYNILIDEDAEYDDYIYYEIVKGKENLINNINEWIGEDDKYKTEEEILNCEEVQGDVYKIRKGLYLINIDGCY